jgi:ubiquinol-cytochrome c reductase cytochrome c1 subunit
MKTLFAVLLSSLLAPGMAFANEGGALQTSGANIADAASLQRGAKLFMNYCVSCHSTEFARYSRIAQDLGLSEEQVMKNLNFTGAKFGEQVKVAMTSADGELWFGKAPPDLSLTARSKPGGPDWIYTYLKSFYIDEARPIGWNNVLLPNASMPNPLWELQGLQRPVFEKDHVTGQPVVAKLKLDQPGLLSPAEYDDAARDIAAFMQYVGEPAAVERSRYGVWVILFLAALTFLTWMVKSEYWRDVH